MRALRHSGLAARRPLWSRLVSTGAAVRSAPPPDRTYQPAFDRVRPDDRHRALREVLEASTAQHGQPPLATMGDAIPALNAAAPETAMEGGRPAFDEFEIAAPLAAFTVSLAEAEASDLYLVAPRTKGSPSSGNTAVPQKVNETPAAAATKPTDDATTLASAEGSPTTVFACSMCERRFRLRASAEMHSQSRHNGQAVITQIDDNAGKKQSETGAASSPATLRGKGKEAPRVAVPTRPVLSAEDIDAFPATVPDFRRPNVPLGSRLTTCFADAKPAAGSSASSSGLAATELNRMFGASAATTPDVISLAASHSLNSRALFVGRVAAVRRGRVAPLRPGPLVPVTEVVLVVEGGANGGGASRTRLAKNVGTSSAVGSDFVPPPAPRALDGFDEISSVGDCENGDVLDPVDVTVLVPAEKDRAHRLGGRGSNAGAAGADGSSADDDGAAYAIRPGSHLMVSGRPRTLHVWHDAAGRGLPAFFVEANHVSVLTGPDE